MPGRRDRPIGASVAPVRRPGMRPSERHKGAPFPTARMGIPAQDVTAAAAVWKAAGDARAWASTIREHTAWDASAQGWSARAEADDAMGRASGALTEAAKAQGRAGAVAMRRAAEAAGLAVGMMRRASESFGRSSRFNGAAVRQLRLAARAYRRAAARDHARDVAGRLAMVGEYAETAAGQASDMGREAESFGPYADTLAMGAAGMEAGWVGGGAAPAAEAAAGLDSSQANVLAVVGRVRKESLDMAERARDAVQMTETLRRLAWTAAEQSAAGTASAREDPGAQRAAAAWKRAMDAAGRAAADDERIRLRRADVDGGRGGRRRPSGAGAAGPDRTA